MTDGLLTRDRLVAHGGARLQAAGVPEARREAWRIWADLLEQPWLESTIFSDQAVTQGQADRFRQAVDRRASGEPLCHVTGMTGFRRLTIRCDARALIPRPETEGLVELLLATAPVGRVADLGTGSGCIALALADEGRYEFILGVDRSREAVALARLNQIGTGFRVEFVLGDFTSMLPAGSLDALVANPPYLTEAEYQRLDPSVKAWEPREALVSGPDGLDATRSLLADGQRVLRPGGCLALEVDASRAAETARLATGLGWQEVSVQDDLFGRARFVLAWRSEES